MYAGGCAEAAVQKTLNINIFHFWKPYYMKWYWHMSVVTLYMSNFDTSILLQRPQKSTFSSTYADVLCMLYWFYCFTVSFWNSLITENYYSSNCLWFYRFFFIIFILFYIFLFYLIHLLDSFSILLLYSIQYIYLIVRLALELSISP